MPAHRCWRCHDQGFVHAPCQACGALRTNRYEGGELVGVEIVYQAGSVWGDQAPPMQSKRRKRQRVDRP